MFVISRDVTLIVDEIRKLSPCTFDELKGIIQTEISAAFLGDDTRGL